SQSFSFLSLCSPNEFRRSSRRRRRSRVASVPGSGPWCSGAGWPSLRGEVVERRLDALERAVWDDEAAVWSLHGGEVEVESPVAVDDRENPDLTELAGYFPFRDAFVLARVWVHQEPSLVGGNESSDGLSGVGRRHSILPVAGSHVPGGRS